MNMKLANDFLITLNFTPQGKEQWGKIDNVKALEALKDWCAKAYNTPRGAHAIFPEYNIIGYVELEDMRRIRSYAIRETPNIPEIYNVIQIDEARLELLSITFLINYIAEFFGV